MSAIVSVAKQARLSLIWSQTTKDKFSRDMPQLIGFHPIPLPATLLLNAVMKAATYCQSLYISQ